MPITQTKRGGVREGAGRKPKALRYANEFAEAEGRIIAALPDVINGLIRAATGDPESGVAPDVAAAKYLIDRVFGRVKEQGAPMAEDATAPLDENEWQAESELAAKEAASARQYRDLMAS